MVPSRTASSSNARSRFLSRSFSSNPRAFASLHFAMSGSISLSLAALRSSNPFNFDTLIMSFMFIVSLMTRICRSPVPLLRQTGHMFSSCFCAPFSRWRKPLMYSSFGSCCCWCISSNAFKTSMRCFFSITRSVCSNSRITVRYRAVLICLQVFIFVCG